MNRLKFLLPLAIVAGGLVIAAVIVKARPNVERQVDAVPPPLVRAMTVTLEDIDLDVASQGTVEPVTESTLVAQVAGQLTYVAPTLADGGFFSRGERLLRIDPRDYELRVAQAEARVAQVHVALEREQAEADLARQEWSDLGTGEPSSLTAREPQLAEALAALRGAEAALEQAQLDLSRTEIHAPFDGRVSRKLVGLGQFVGAGTPVAEVFATDVAEIRLPVEEAELAFLDLDLGAAPAHGSEPRVRLTGSGNGPQTSWEGRIVRTGSRFDQRTRMLELFARVDDPFARRSERPPLPMGLFVQAEIAGRTASDVAVLPRAAIRAPSRVLVVADDRLHYRDVEVLRFNGDRAIVSAGLESGDQVCVSTLEAVVDGMSVRVELDDLPIRTDQDAEAEL